MTINWNNNSPTIYGWDQMLKVVWNKREISVKVDDMHSALSQHFSEEGATSEPVGEANFECKFHKGLWNLLTLVSEGKEIVQLSTTVHGTFPVMIQDMRRDNEKMFISTKIMWELMAAQN